MTTTKQSAMHAVTLDPTPGNIRRAADALLNGELVAFPTETVFGLGAAVTQPDAVRNIFQSKGRPANHPLIAHAHCDFDWQAGWVDVHKLPHSHYFEILAKAFWPGPLTMIVPKGPLMPLSVTGGQSSVGVRCPSHSSAAALLAAVGVPVAAPSANRFGKVSPTRAAHVVAELGDRIPYVLDGSEPEVGIESTIVSLLGEQLAVLRPGVITASQIEQVLGVSVKGHVEAGKPGQNNPRVSGALEKHYSPNAKVYVVSAQELMDLQLGGKALCVGWSDGFLQAADRLRSHHSAVLVEALNDSPQGVAKVLYTVLRQADDLACKQVLFERPPVDAQWEGIADRLKRAAS